MPGKPDDQAKEAKPVGASVPGATPALKVSDPEAALTRPAGGIQMSAAAGGGLAAAVSPAKLGLEADVSDELAASAPSFGGLLLAIGDGVAASQTALDQSVIDTVKALAGTKIDVVTEVIETLDDDGLPSAENTRLITQNLSVLNFITPTVHEWKHVAVSMDLSVGEIDRETGVTFNRKQSSSLVSGVGLFWGAIGFNRHSDSEATYDTTTKTDYEADWATGQIRLDALLGPRRTTKFPVPADITVGPQISVSMGSVNEIKTGNVVTARTQDVILSVRKANGEANPNVPVELDAGSLQPSFKTSEGYNGSTTNGSGKVFVTLRRTIPSPAFSTPYRQRLSASFGMVRKTFDVTL